MTNNQVKKLRSGLYRIHWKNGEISLASIGRSENGDAWIAPRNENQFDSTEYWKDIDRVELLHQVCPPLPEKKDKKKS